MVSRAERRRVSTYTVSGDAEHIYVSDETGRVIAMCDQLHDAHRVADALNQAGLRLWKLWCSTHGDLMDPTDQPRSTTCEFKRVLVDETES